MKSKKCWQGILIPVLLGGLSIGGSAQNSGDVFGPSGRRNAASREPLPAIGPSRSLKLLKQSFEQTQKDTARLYELASELKQEMDNTDEDVLSVTVMKKAEEIEKLAEKIKNRMKNL
jgi:hypothetical protein